MSDWICKLNNVSFHYPSEQDILHDLSFTIPRGSCMAFLGASGSGKSTIAQLLAGFLIPSSGECSWNFQQSLKPRDRFKQKQLVFQDPSSSLTPFYTPFKTVQEILKLFYEDLIDVDQKTEEVLKTFGINQEIFHKKNLFLSGGEKQRLTLARAFCINPEFLILDEPLSSCDPFLQKEILYLIKSQITEKNLSVAIILHDLNHALFLADTICLLKDGQIEALENKDSFLLTPGTAYKQTFIEAFY